MAVELDNAMAMLWSREPDEATAFEKAFPVLRSFVCALAYRRLSNETWSEDAAQESLLALWEVWSSAPDRFESSAHLTRYFFRIAVSKIEDLRRKSSRYVPVDGASVLEQIEQALVAAPDDASLTDGERRKLIEEALASLPEDQRIALELHVLGERDGREAARQMGIEHSALRKRVSRGLNRLRGLFGRRGAL